MNRYYGNKYHAVKTMCDGIEFDSKREAERYRELRLLEKAGKIHNLRRQVPHILIPSVYDQVNGKRVCIEKECKYIADFEYMDEDWHTIVEDVKGYKGGAGYSVFVIKRKLMLHLFGIRVREIK